MLYCHITYYRTLNRSIKELFSHWIYLFAKTIGNSEKEAHIRCRFEEVAKTYGRLIERICFGYAKSLQEMEDLRQDSLINLWESMDNYRGSCSMKTWVYRITLNTCVSSFRKRQRQINTVRLTELFDTIDNNDDKYILTELHTAISGLNPIDKAVVMLWLDEQSYDEISSIVGISKANVSTRLHRAKEKLKKLIQD